MEGLIPEIYASVQPIAFMFCLRMVNSISTYSSCKSLAIMTDNFSFGAKNAYFKFSSSGFNSNVGDSYIEGANLARLASAPAICENYCTTTSLYPMETKLAEVA